MRETDITGADEEHAVRQVELLQETLGVAAEELEFGEGLVRVDPLHEFDLIELVQAVETTHVGAPAAGFATEARRVTAALHGQGRLVEDLVAEEIRHRHLRRRDHVEIIRLRVVHLALLVRQLTGRGRAGGIHHQGGVDFRVAVATGLLEEVLDERAHEAGHVADVEREAGTGHLHAALEVDGLIEPSDIPVGLGGGGNELGLVAPRGDDLVVGLGAAFGHGVVRDIGYGKGDGLHLLFDFGDLLLELLHLGGGGLHLDDLSLELRRALRQGGHFLVRGVLRGASHLELGHRMATGLIGGQDGVEVDLELLPGNALADEVDVFAKELGIQHGPTLPNSPARGQRGSHRRR